MSVALTSPPPPGLWGDGKLLSQPRQVGGGHFLPRLQVSTEGWDFRSIARRRPSFFCACGLNTWSLEAAQAIQFTWQKSQWDFAKVRVDPKSSPGTEWTLKSGSGKGAKWLSDFSFLISASKPCCPLLELSGFFSLLHQTISFAWQKPTRHHESQHWALYVVR